MLLRTTGRFFVRYWQLCAALAAAIVGLIFQFVGPVAAAHWVLGCAALLLTIPLLVGMWQEMREGHAAIDILAVTAIITAVFLHQYWVGILLVLLLVIVALLNNYARQRAMEPLNALLNQPPHQAHVLRRAQAIDVPAKEVRVGERIIIKQGETVPADASIMAGSAKFDESILFGDSTPKPKRVNDALYSGSVNLGGTITAKVLRVAAESQYEQTKKLARAAAHSQAPLVRLADRFAIPFMVVVLVVAGGLWVLSGQAIRFLEVLVVATPAPFVLAAPIAIAGGISRAAKQGIFARHASALERLAEIHSVVFAKTGTLTTGQFKVLTVRTYGKATTAEVLGYAASLEQGSNHLLASAIISRTQQLKAKTYKTKNARQEAGLGLSGASNGKQVLVGRAELLHRHGVVIDKKIMEAAAGQTHTFVAIGGQLAGVISLQDDIRPDGRRAIARLHRNGIRDIYLVTGDTAPVAKRVAKQVGIALKQVAAQALPVDKLQLIEKTVRRPAAFVGDSASDAPALAAADVGIALGATGPTAASHAADIIIPSDSLLKVADAHAISLRTFSTARRSIVLGTILNIGLIILFVTGRIPPIYGVAAQGLVDAVVLYNAMRARRG